MDKKTAIIIVFCLIVFISIRVHIALNVSQTESGGESPELFPKELPATYTGLLPCASCPGIESHLLLRNDGFREVSWYIDRDEGPVTNVGSWSVSGDTLTLSGENVDRYKRFLIENSHLRMLDQERHKIEGELSDNYLLEFSEMEHKIRENHAKFKEQGVSFIASGNEPFWSVRTDMADSLRYITPEGEKAGALTSYSDHDLLAKLNDDSDITLDIREEYCRDTMSGFLFTHTVSVSLDEQQLNGCGRYL